MKELYKDYLFTKHILVAEQTPDERECFNAIISLENQLGIKVTKGKKFASLDVFKYAAEQIGEYIPSPFYRTFPEGVKELTKDELLFDQLYNYFVTYGLDSFDNPFHSVFEKDVERLAFNEDIPPKDFEILSETEAIDKLQGYVIDMLESSRPLSEDGYSIVCEAMKDYMIAPKAIPCKQTAVRLLHDTKDVYRYSRYISLADVIKLVDYINYTVYGNENLKKLNLKNKDRKLITSVIDFCLSCKRYNYNECFEKRKIWCGLLHHIHYRPFNDESVTFVTLIREGKNISAYSRFEEAMSDNDVGKAAEILYKEKGSSVVIRNLNYLLSRCKSEKDVKEVLSWVK